MPFVTTEKNAALAAMSANILDVGIHTLVDPGLGTTANAGEASGGSYARQGVTWATAASGLQSNSNAITVPVPAGTYGFVTFWNAATGNTAGIYQGYSPMGGASAIKGFAQVDPTFANADFFCAGHGLSNGNTLFLYADFGGAYPTTLATGTLYYVVGATTNTFQLSLTLGGSAIVLTALGAGVFYWQRIVSEVFNAAGNITIAIGALVLDATAM
ncbi:MAG: phage tail fiber protein [Pseudonocardiaceae bacterium]